MEPTVAAKIMDKLKAALETIRARASKDKLPSLDALRVMLNKMKPKDPNEPTKINYYGGVFKLGPKTASARAIYHTSNDKEHKRVRKAWEAGVQSVPRPER